MKTAVIAPLGMSPPVITTFVDGIGEPISDLVIMTTENETVKAGLELIKIGMKQKYPKTRVHEVIISFDDVLTTEQNLRFMSIAAKVIRDEREEYGCNRILLNIAGGRKNMCITLSLLGQLMSVDGVFHVVSKDVYIVNQQLESLREDIRRIYNAKTENEKLNLYLEKERYFDTLLFPDKSEYEIVRIPTLPYPKGYLTKILTAVYSDPEMLSSEEKVLLERHGIFERTGNRHYLSDYGRRFVEVLLGK
jgi:CRISPR-associated protein Csx14